MTETKITLLLNPGPVNLSAGVRAALTRPDLCHREPEFAVLQDSIRQKLLQVYHLSPQQWSAVLLAGSGTAAVEAMLSSLIPQTGKLLILENGVYGERMTRICECHGIDHRVISYSWGEPIDTAAVTHELEIDTKLTHMAAVHHETTTGRLNNLTALGLLCRGRGIQLLVDGVSSFGAEILEFDTLAACAATANKCLHGAPGVSFVVVRRDVLAPANAPKRSLYLDLETYCREQDAHTTPFTQPIQVYYALEQALTELENEGGRRERYRHYRTLAHAIREGLLVMGIKPLLKADESSVVLTAYHLPDQLDYQALHDALKTQGFVIYAGQGKFANNIFRISTMGTITTPDIERLLVAFRTLLSTPQ